MFAGFSAFMLSKMGLYHYAGINSIPGAIFCKVLKGMASFAATARMSHTNRLLKTGIIEKNTRKNI